MIQQTINETKNIDNIIIELIDTHIKKINIDLQQLQKLKNKQKIQKILYKYPCFISLISEMKTHELKDITINKIQNLQYTLIKHKKSIATHNITNTNITQYIKKITPIILLLIDIDQYNQNDQYLSLPQLKNITMTPTTLISFLPKNTPEKFINRPIQEVNEFLRTLQYLINARIYQNTKTGIRHAISDYILRKTLYIIEWRLKNTEKYRKDYSINSIIKKLQLLKNKWIEIEKTHIFYNTKLNNNLSYINKTITNNNNTSNTDKYSKISKLINSYITTLIQYEGKILLQYKNYSNISKELYTALCFEINGTTEFPYLRMTSEEFKEVFLPKLKETNDFIVKIIPKTTITNDFVDELQKPDNNIRGYEISFKNTILFDKYERPTIKLTHIYENIDEGKSITLASIIFSKITLNYIDLDYKNTNELKNAIYYENEIKNIMLGIQEYNKRKLLINNNNSFIIHNHNNTGRIYFKNDNKYYTINNTINTPIKIKRISPKKFIENKSKLMHLNISQINKKYINQIIEKYINQIIETYLNDERNNFIPIIIYNNLNKSPNMHKIRMDILQKYLNRSPVRLYDINTFNIQSIPKILIDVFDKTPLITKDPDEYEISIHIPDKEYNNSVFLHEIQIITNNPYITKILNELDTKTKSYIILYLIIHLLGSNSNKMLISKQNGITAIQKNTNNNKSIDD